jgi:hypothetical protein
LRKSCEIASLRPTERTRSRKGSFSTSADARAAQSLTFDSCSTFGASQFVLTFPSRSAFSRYASRRAR